MLLKTPATGEHLVSKEGPHVGANALKSFEAIDRFVNSH